MSDLVPLPYEASIVPVDGDVSPVARLLARYVSPKSKTSILWGLKTIAAMGAEPDPFRVRWWELTLDHTEAIRARLAQAYEPSSCNLALSALRAILRQCERQELMSPDRARRASDFQNVRAERLPRGRALPAGEIRALFEGCEKERDIALLALLYGAGLRRAEVVGLDLADYDGEALRVLGKGNKQRLVPLPTGAKTALDSWIEKRGREPGPLLLPLTRSGAHMRRLAIGSIYDITRVAAQRAGTERFGPHDMRRTFVSDLLDAGADIATVQRLAGHAQVTTTQRYDRRPEAVKKKAVELLHVPVRKR